MAIITEEAEEIQPHEAKKEPTSPSPAENPTTKPESIPKPNPNSQTRTNPFIFWFYFTLLVSLITAFTISFSSFSPSSDPKSFFLSLSTPLRHHYSKGRTIKVQLAENQPQIEIFAWESGKEDSSTEKVLIVHGLGLSSFSFRKVVDFLGSKAVHGVAFDLPGNGFSDKTVEVIVERGNGVLERFSDMYALIKEKGVFWAFDNMVESGEIPYEEILSHYNKGKSVVRPIVLGSEEVGKVLSQLIGTMGLAPVHLVLHDSSLAMVANWVLENPGIVRSVTLVDTGSRPALPLWVLKMPVVREVLLGSSFAYERLISFCCSKGIGSLDLEAHRVVLRGRDGGRAVFGTRLNSSFDLAEWGGLDDIKRIPMQLLWSSSWSREWSEEGHRMSEALPQAKLVTHTGGRWPQEDAADELGEHIVKFVSSLPKSVRQAEEEPIPEHIQKMLNEAIRDEHNHDHDHHHHHGHGGHDHHGHGGHDHHGGHAHMHGAGYMDAYGLGHAWGS